MNCRTKCQDDEIATPSSDFKSFQQCLDFQAFKICIRQSAVGGFVDKNNFQCVQSPGNCDFVESKSFPEEFGTHVYFFLNLQLNEVYQNFSLWMQDPTLLLPRIVKMQFQ